MKQLIKILLFVPVLLLLPADAEGQDSIYYFSADYGIAADPAEATYRKTVERRSSRAIIVSIDKRIKGDWEYQKTYRYLRQGDLQYRIISSEDPIIGRKISRTFQRTGDGMFVFTDQGKGDRVLREGTSSSMIPLILQDTVVTYHPKTRRVQSVGVYRDNRLLGNQNWLINGNQYYDDLFYHVESEPEFKPGPVFFRNYIMSGLSESGIDLGQVSDEVIIGWVIMEDGSKEGFHAISGIFSDLNALLVKLISEMPGEWVPAKINGEPVRYYMQIPFNFIQRTENFESLELTSGFIVWD